MTIQEINKGMEIAVMILNPIAIFMGILVIGKLIGR
jgi:hypothetical protein